MTASGTKPPAKPPVPTELDLRLEAAIAGLPINARNFREYMQDDLDDIESGRITPETLRICAATLALRAPKLDRKTLDTVKGIIDRKAG